MPKKKWYMSRTIWLGIITTAIGVLGVIETNYPGLAIVTTLSGSLAIVLRFFTSTELE